MKRELLETILPAGFCAVTNWSVGVYMVDWEPGRKYYGGQLVDGVPDPQPSDDGRWFTSRKAAKAYALGLVERIKAVQAEVTQ